MMFLRSVFLGSLVIVASASSVEHLVDDADIKVRGATLEPISQCPGTTGRTFHHDSMQKDQRAEATFHFNPPRDGCYIIEERTERKKWMLPEEMKCEFIANTKEATEQKAPDWMLPESNPEMMKCEASANTKVHVHFCKGLQAVGTVDQTPKAFRRQPQDQWTFIAALQFYAGHPGSVTLSNEGTKPGTLTVFDQVRFSWSGTDCFETHAHPRRAEIRITVDFQHAANRLTIFGLALKKKLAGMSGIPEKSLRLTGLRPGSVTGGELIAEFLVLPIVVDDAGLGPARGLDLGSAKLSIRRLGIALSETKKAAELCNLFEDPLTGCNVELNDLGFAMPTVKALPVPEQLTQQQQGNGTQAIIVVKTKIHSPNTTAHLCETKVQSVEAWGEERNNSVKEKELVEQDDDKSTVCPFISDQQSKVLSESAFCGNGTGIEGMP